MRKILFFARNGIAALSAVTRSASPVTIGVSLAVTFCLTSATHAQTLAQQLTPTAMSLQDAPVSSAAAGALSRQFPTVDAAYSVLAENRTSESSVEPASFLGGRLRGHSYTAPVSDACNAGCDVSWYFSYEGLFFRRENDERFSMSRNNFMPDFEYEFGGRYTAGRLLDCVNAWEIVYAGPFDWQRQSTVSAPGTLQSQLQPVAPFGAGVLTTFNDADRHTQAYRAQLNSFELNRRWWVWDVVSTMIGMRYIDYEEDYLFLSESAAGNGVLNEAVDNQLIGGQIGADILYPVSLRSNIGFKGKAGVYANFDERSTFLRNGSNVIINAGDTNVDVAGLIELGVFANYHVVPSVRLTAGYEFWYMPGMATIPDQDPNLIGPNSGTAISESDELLFHGASVGAQILF